jgi:ketosteroid isomerase-like protein
MSPTAAERDALFKTFGRAWFKRDVELLYQAVSPDFVWASLDAGGEVTRISGREGVAAAWAAQAARFDNVRFADVVYHHAPDATFMTFRMSSTEKATGRALSEEGVEHYTFKDGRIAVKDVFRKRVVAGSGE